MLFGRRFSTNSFLTVVCNFSFPKLYLYRGNRIVVSCKHFIYFIFSVAVQKVFSEEYFQKKGEQEQCVLSCFLYSKGLLNVSELWKVGKDENLNLTAISEISSNSGGDRWPSLVGNAVTNLGVLQFS